MVTNTDVLTEILLRLPIKSLIRFKSVSKTWLYLITDPYFLRRVNSQMINPVPSGIFLCRSLLLFNQHQHLLISDQNPLSPLYKAFSFAPDSSLVKIMQSCNGLLLLSCSPLISSRYDNPNYYVFNPTTKQFTLLPMIQTCSSLIISGVTLVFDPAKSPNYKVVRVSFVNHPNAKHFQIEIYSSEEGSWKVCGEPFTVNLLTKFPDGVFWNGSVHWISAWGGKSFFFDVDKEILQTLPMPARDVLRPITTYFGESCGHLHLIEVCELPMLKFDVYELERDYSGWFVRYSVDLRSIAPALHDSIKLDCYKTRLLSVFRGENDEESFLLLHMHGSVVRYNFIDGTFKELCNLGFGFGGQDQFERSVRFGGSLSASSFIESLSFV